MKLDIWLPSSRRAQKVSNEEPCHTQMLLGRIIYVEVVDVQGQVVGRHTRIVA